MRRRPCDRDPQPRHQPHRRQPEPEGGHRQRGVRLDRALTDALELDLAADVTLTSAQFREHACVRATGHGVTRVLTVPALRRPFLVVNAGTAALTVRRGTTDLVLAAGSTQAFYADGTSNGLVAVAPAVEAAGAGHDVGVFIAGRPEEDELVLTFVAVRAFTLPAGLTGSRGHAAAATTATFAMASAQTFEPGDRLELLAPADQDATLAHIALTLRGTRA